MAVETVVKVIILVASFVITTAVPFVISLVNAIKKRKAAQTEADKQAAINDMLAQANTFIGDAEALYKSIDSIVKAQGGSTGANKKDSVMTKLQAYAISKGYEFDAEFWSGKIDEVVALTRKVNTTVKR
ncbi:MAG: hypothetical protein IJE92_01230 [Clostridia bacterium]|nr:hypothetical protein [Clostridia bacterium]